MPASSPRARWAKRIRAASRKTVESMIQTGKLLIEAKRKLGHGDFVAMVRNDLPFKERTAQRLMNIARSPAISKASNWSLLPPHLSTLHDLAALPPETFDVKIASGAINPDATREQLRIESPRERPSAPLTSEESHEAFLRANKNRVVEAVLDLRRINSAPDEIAALLADGSRKQFKTDLAQAIQFLTALQAALDQNEREQARQVVVPLLRPSVPPPGISA
jgi:Protein of unknown function (DUF3102)